ncbi:MAG: pantoate--beta-alanine ligase [Betaproteobacteria bacterium]|nr:pantoate--beta-alanine ligase [Betaproteobacteria bacterium]
MQVVESVSALRGLLGGQSAIAFVPTMGNLHEGHVTLMREARKRGRIVVVSIFVNRLQFGPQEDFDRYPRTFAADCAKLESEGVDYVFAPDEQVLFPHPQDFFVIPSPQLADILEGEFRPGYFRGVATIVAKLFNIVQPAHAIFGMKDYQQLRVIERMVAQLNMPIAIQPNPTVRAGDGLALSSRNNYLSAAERSEAPNLHRVMRGISVRLQSGERAIAKREAEAALELTGRGWQVDYITVRRQSDLGAQHGAREPLVVLGAARIGKTRLIDSLEVG